VCPPYQTTAPYPPAGPYHRNEGERKRERDTHTHEGAKEGEQAPTSSDLKHGNHRVHRIEQRLLILLQVLIVRTREAFEGGDEASGVAQDATSLPPQEFEGVGVLFLRHEGGAGRVGVGESDLCLVFVVVWVDLFWLEFNC